MSKRDENSSDGYVEEIQRRIPLRLTATFVLSVLLYWGSQFGVYKSSLLGLLYLSGDWFIKNTNKLLEIPLYIYFAAIFFNIFLHKCIQAFIPSYYRYVTNLPAISERIKAMFNKNIVAKVHEDTVSALLAEIESAKYKTRSKADTSHVLLLASGSFFIATYFGNILDFSIGLLLLLVGLYFLYRSCGIYIAELIPKRAHLRAIYLSEESKLQTGTRKWKHAKGISQSK